MNWKNHAVFIALFLLFVSFCTGEQSTATEQNRYEFVNDLQDTVNAEQLFVLLKKEQLDSREFTWTIYDVINETFTEIVLSNEQLGIISTFRTWFWNPVNGASYIQTTGAKGPSGFFQFTYDEQSEELKSSHIHDAREFRTEVMILPNLHTDNAEIHVIPNETDNRRISNYFDIEVTLDSDQVKVFPLDDVEIARVAYGGKNVIFAEVLEKPVALDRLPETSAVLWNYITDQYYVLKDEKALGFGSGYAVVTTEYEVGLSIIDVEGVPIYNNSDVDLYDAINRWATIGLEMDIGNVYYIHPYIILEIRTVITPFGIAFFNIETGSYYSIRGSSAVYEPFGVFSAGE